MSTASAVDDPPPPRASTLDIWQAALHENLGYYRTTGRLIAQFWFDVASVVTNATQPLTMTIPRRPTRQHNVPAPSTTRPGGHPLLLLEGRAGDTAVGAFVVENHLGELTEASVQSSVFTNNDGMTIPVDVRFDPAHFALDPGGQILIRAYANVSSEFEPGVPHDGEFSVPGLPGGPVNVRIRRLHDSD